MMRRAWSVLAVIAALTFGVAPTALLAQEVGECPSDDPNCNDPDDGSGGETGEPEPSPEPTPSPSRSPSPSPEPSPSPSPSPSPTASPSHTTSEDDSAGGSSTDPDDGGDATTSGRSDPDSSGSTSSSGDSAGWSAWRDSAGMSFDTFELPVPQHATTDTEVQVAPLRPEVAGPAARPVPAGNRSTVAVLEAAGLLHGPTDAVVALLAPFPVAGPAVYDLADAGEHPWLELATAIVSQPDVPVVAVDGGTVTGLVTDDPELGNAVEVTTARGVRYVYAHLGTVADGVTEGATVDARRILGTVGRTGAGGPSEPHLLFALHRDGTAMSALPHLDRWLAAATVRARASSVSVRAVPVGGTAAAPAGQRAVPIRHAGVVRDRDAVALPTWWPLPLAALAWFLVGRRTRRRTAARVTALRAHPGAT